MSPVFSQFGQLLGWLSGNVLYGADGKNIAFLRGNYLYSNARIYLGKVVSGRGGRLVLREEIKAAEGKNG